MWIWVGGLLSLVFLAVCCLARHSACVVGLDKNSDQKQILFGTSREHLKTGTTTAGNAAPCVPLRSPGPPGQSRRLASPVELSLERAAAHTAGRLRPRRAGRQRWLSAGAERRGKGRRGAGPPRPDVHRPILEPRVRREWHRAAQRGAAAARPVLSFRSTANSGERYWRPVAAHFPARSCHIGLAVQGALCTPDQSSALPTRVGRLHRTSPLHHPGRLRVRLARPLSSLTTPNR